MAVERLGTAGMTNEMKQTYDRILLSVAKQNLVFANYGLQKEIPARGGKSVEWRRFEKIAVASDKSVLTEGTNPSETAATVSNVAATISQYGAYSKISDLLEFQAFDPVIAEFANLYGIHMAETVDTIIRDDVLGGITTNQYAGDGARVGTSGTGAVGSGDYLDAAELKEADRTLSRANAKKIGGNWIIFIHPDNKTDLFNDTELNAAFEQAAPKEAGNPLFTGVLGNWMGFKFIESTNVLVRSSYGMSGADVYEVMVCGAEAYGVTKLSALQARMIIHSKEQEGGPLEAYSTVGWKAALCAKVLNADWIVRIYCASSRTPSA